MSRNYIPASYERNEYEKAVFTEAIVYSVDLSAATPTKITNAALTSFGLADALVAGGTRVQFDTLVGNLPWSSYSKFASTQPRTTTPPIPYASLPSAGSVTITEGNVSEVMYYGSISWTSQTAGFLNNVKRSSTTNAFTAAATGVFTNVVPVREFIRLFNRTGAVLYMGYDGNINNTTNSVQIPDGGSWGIWLEPLQDIWVYSVGGTVRVQDTFLTIAEYR